MAIADHPAVERKLDELDLRLSPEIDYRLETVFPSQKGKLANRAVRRRVKLIHSLEPLLEDLLFEKEVVHFLCKGKQSASSRTWWLGFLGEENIKLRVVLVLTNLRVLCILTNGRGVPERTYWSIYYTQIEQIETSFTDEVKLQLLDGQRLNYYEFTKLEIQTLKQTARELTANYEANGFDPPVTQSWEQLCGNCFQIVPPRVYECDCCRTQFWRPLEIAVRSFAFPPWGTYVLGHRGVALWETAVFLLILIYDINAIHRGNFLGPLILLLFGNGLASIFTSQNAVKGLYLKDGE